MAVVERREETAETAIASGPPIRHVVAYDLSLQQLQIHTDGLATSPRYLVLEWRDANEAHDAEDYSFRLVESWNRSEEDLCPNRNAK